MPESCPTRWAGDRVLACLIRVRSAPMIGRERQTAIYLGGVSGRRPRVPLDPERLEEAARKAMPADAFAYIKAGAGTEDTVRENRAAFARHRIVPRMLRGAAQPDASVELFGRRVGLRGAAQHPRHDPPARERGAGLAHGVHRAGARRDVGVVVGGHRLLRRLLQAVGVDRDARAAPAHPAEVDGRLAVASDHGG